ncbi:Hypothetical protein, partial CDS, partial [Neorhizobium galegae bv. orientalis]
MATRYSTAPPILGYHLTPDRSS